MLVYLLAMPAYLLACLLAVLACHARGPLPWSEICGGASAQLRMLLQQSLFEQRLVD